MTYTIRQSFGGKPVGSAGNLKGARVLASKLVQEHGPVDVWSNKGGHYGVGKVVDHFPKEKGRK